jgi:hypothetical protein
MGAKIEYTSYKFIKPPMLTEPEFVKWKADIERTLPVSAITSITIG